MSKKSMVEVKTPPPPTPEKKECPRHVPFIVESLCTIGVRAGGMRHSTLVFVCASCGEVSKHDVIS